MRNDLTEFPTPQRREPPGESVARAARDRSAQDMARRDMARQREDGARPRFTLPDNADQTADARRAGNAAEAARGAPRNAPERKDAPPGTFESASSRPAPAQTGTSRAALMRGQGGPVEKTGEAEPTNDVAAMLRALAGPVEAQETEGEGDQDAAADAQAEEAASRMQVAPDADGQDADQADYRDGDDAGDNAAGDGEEAVMKDSQSADPDAMASDQSADETDAAPPVQIPGEPAQADEAEAADPEAEAATAAASGNPASENASDAARSATADRGNSAATPAAVAGEGARANQAAGPGATSAAAAGQAAATGDAESDADGDAEDGGEPGGDEAEAEQKGRSGRAGGGEDRSPVAQEALRRALGGEAGVSRAAMGPGNGEQPVRHAAEQAMRMMQASAEAFSAQAKSGAQAAAEASATANGQANAANQAGVATPQVNGAVLINTPLSAVPMALGMKAMGGASRFEIRLDPAELGRVAVSLDIDDEGTVKARLVVDRVETLQLLQRDARTLERAFEQAGLKPSEDGIEMSLRDDRGGNAREDKTGDEDPRASGDGRGSDMDDNGLAAAEIRALARETLLARQELRRALGGVDLSI